MNIKMAKKLPLVSVVIPTYNRKEKLIRLLESILQSDYPRLEIIVVDDASTDGTYNECKKRFHNRIKIIRNKRELFVSGSRNVGLKNAKGEYIFVIDDDNIIDKKCIYELVKIMEEDKSIGVAAPIMYYLEQPNRVWCAGERRNMFTSISYVIGKDEVDNGQFPELIDCMYVPNAFMIRRKIIKLVLFDEVDFPFQHEDIDFCFKVRKLGYRIVCNTKAKVWHDVPVEWNSFLEKTNIEREIKVYFVGRNRILLQRKYSNYIQLLFFILIALPLITLYHCLGLLLGADSKRRYNLIKYYLLGTLNGFIKTDLINRGC